MKTLVAAVLALLAVAPLRAEVLRPEAVNGAVLGGVAGAIIGHNSGDLRHNAWRGAAYGAGAGVLLGTIAGDARHRRAATQVPVPDYPRTYLYREAPAYYGRPAYYASGWHRSHSVRHRYRHHYGAPVVYGASGYYGGTFYGEGDYGRPDYRGSGLLWGALAGAVIGHNSGDLRHNGWRGAAYGAGLGYVIGSVAEHRARQREAGEMQPVAAAAPADAYSDTNAATAVPATAPAPALEPATAPSTMSAANRLFGR